MTLKTRFGQRHFWNMKLLVQPSRVSASEKWIKKNFQREKDIDDDHAFVQSRLMPRMWPRFEFVFPLCAFEREPVINQLSYLGAGCKKTETTWCE
jgi:hypothetical protein